MITWTAMNILFSTNTLASRAEYEPTFIALTPFHKGARPGGDVPCRPLA